MPLTTSASQNRVWGRAPAETTPRSPFSLSCALCEILAPLALKFYTKDVQDEQDNFQLSCNLNLSDRTDYDRNGAHDSLLYSGLLRFCQGQQGVSRVHDFGREVVGAIYRFFVFIGSKTKQYMR